MQLHSADLRAKPGMKDACKEDLERLCSKVWIRPCAADNEPQGGGRCTADPPKGKGWPSSLREYLSSVLACSQKLPKRSHANSGNAARPRVWVQIQGFVGRVRFWLSLSAGSRRLRGEGYLWFRRHVYHSEGGGNACVPVRAFFRDSLRTVLISLGVACPSHHQRFVPQSRCQDSQWLNVVGCWPPCRKPAQPGPASSCRVERNLIELALPRTDRPG